MLSASKCNVLDIHPAIGKYHGLSQTSRHNYLRGGKRRLLFTIPVRFRWKHQHWQLRPICLVDFPPICPGYALDIYALISGNDVRLL
ncbi:uncharacterized protein UV8b_06770 [Ustilaginoidea virens]|uniref:Uncharacterized protein n=1 Tax=Ustilaginoidea virens TaxID=1159556 RepID=A0A8E5HWI5_USTVR|nr:uncharacterized protein UV8b_06770 [Ustilaginoidea virens]QUC22529.1 hypothetical protein UV8b_06770 [Ustilaginoidea virens]